MSKKHMCEISFESDFFQKSDIKFPYEFLYPVIIGNYDENGAWTARITIYDCVDSKSNAEIELIFAGDPDDILTSGSSFVLSPGFYMDKKNSKKLCIRARGRII